MKKKNIPKTPPPSGVERYTVGDGLTKRNMVKITGLRNPSPEAIAELDAMFKRIGKVSTFNGRIRSSEKWAQDILACDPDAEQLPYESEAWYAAKIISVAGLLQKIMARIHTYPEAARKETDALAKFAFELGVLASEAAHKFAFEADALLGISRRAQQRIRGKIRGQSISAEKQVVHNSWKEEADKIRKEKPGKSKSYVAGIVKSRLKSSASVRTIRAVI